MLLAPIRLRRVSVGRSARGVHPGSVGCWAWPNPSLLVGSRLSRLACRSCLSAGSCQFTSRSGHALRLGIGLQPAEFSIFGSVP